MTPKDRAASEFKKKYGDAPPWIVRSPGRVNLIGGHTDYNDGFVLPMAINYATWIAFRPRQDDRVEVMSLDMDDTIEFNLKNLEKSKSGWGEYVKGVAWALKEKGFVLKGWEGILIGNVPIGAGLSSSASIELSVAKAFSLASGFEWDPVEIAKAAQHAENEWVGMKCGIMDQLISAAGKKDSALLIDCRSLELRSIPFPSNIVAVILDTNTRRGLVDSAYNERRNQCESAASFFGVLKLRDVSLEDFNKRKEEMEPLERRRAQHVITENNRVLESVDAMESGDAALLGELLNAAHKSISEDYDVSSNELNAIVEIAQAQPGCFGARMTGAGFGGCAVALVDKSHLDEFLVEVVEEYKERTGLDSEVYSSSASEGTNLVGGSRRAA
jgi:galactokinase